MASTGDQAGNRVRRFGGALACLLVAGLIHASPAGGFLDAAAGDAIARLLRRVDPLPATIPDVAVVGIDEADLRAIPEPLALMHVPLGAFLQAASAGGATAIGVDIALPDRPYDALAPGLDRALLTSILATRARTPVVFARTVQADGQLRDVEPRLRAIAGADGLGAAIFPRDADGVVRRFDERLGRDGAAVPVFAGQLARALGVPVRAGAIDYTVGPRFAYVPLRDVLAWHERGDTAALQRAFAGRPVLLGAVLPFEDRVEVPVDLAGWDDRGAGVPGVLAQAQALRALRAGRVVPIAPAWTLALALVLGSLAWFAPWRARTTLLLAVAASVLFAAIAAGAWRAGVALAPAAAPLALWLAVLARLGVDAAAQLRERRRLRAAFGASVSPEVLRRILDGRLAPRLGGELVSVCVLFSDIRGFTTRSESLTPETTVALLNRYFERMVAAIHAEQGTITSFIGDGIMAIFGAPQALADPCASAFAAARAMDAALAGFNRELEAEGLPPIEAGIGLHAGPVVVGRIGAQARSDYTAIGDAPNVASRVEGLTKGLGFRIVCTRDVAAALPQDSGLVPLGVQAIKGHSPVEVFGWGKLAAAGPEEQGATRHAIV